ncbi:hypothetical protein [Maritimibacter sp. DP1N21-5]|uniref:hypothetical protein n=1 Tax=Maritimibacter sp. DP1N21-5 TaxID=2836867 RepID=UPI001C489420|nr:hypothetical protein [Maritimibacter sp. DP1N21-5]MBV7410515.1 hypothetical protein [Maritimibacter sp. DP1N21-5]
MAGVVTFIRVASAIVMIGAALMAGFQVISVGLTTGDAVPDNSGVATSLWIAGGALALYVVTSLWSRRIAANKPKDRA